MHEHPRTIAVALSKGGVGKTTTAVNLAHALALAGRRCLLVDTDTQGQAAAALGVHPTAGLAELAQGERVDPFEARPGLFLLAGGERLAGETFAVPGTLADALELVTPGFDLVIIDAAPGWDALTVNVLLVASEILVPVSLEPLTVQALATFAGRVARVARHNPGATIRHILPTFHDRRVRRSGEVLAQLARAYPAELCSPIRTSVRLSEAPAWGRTIFEHAPTSTGADDYRTLTQRILST